MFNSQLKTLIQYFLPQHALSRLAGLIANCHIPWFKNWLIDDFIRRYNVDLSCAVETDPHQYADFNSFFTRKLQPHARPIAAGKDVIICPVDGSVSQLGIIQAGNIVQAKGFNYDVQQLLGGLAERAAPFQHGHFITLYLAPKDYHRVHMPFAGRLQEMIHVPGRLFSVNPATVDGVPNLFARNERVAALFETEMGPMAVVMVGAMLVASINTVWAGMVSPPQRNKVNVWQYAGQQNLSLTQGAEMGHFQLGSTVIVLFSNPHIAWDSAIKVEQDVRFGQLLAKGTRVK